MGINTIPVNVNEVFGFFTEDGSKAGDERVPFYPCGFLQEQNSLPLHARSTLLRIFNLGIVGLIIRYLTVEYSIAIIPGAEC